MGRNGKNKSVFTEMVDFVSKNAGTTVTSGDILLGMKPGRNSATGYLYKFIKLGYVKAVEEEQVVSNPDSKYYIAKPFPEKYTSVMLMAEMRAAAASK